MAKFEVGQIVYINAKGSVWFNHTAQILEIKPSAVNEPLYVLINDVFSQDIAGLFKEYELEEYVGQDAYITGA